MTLWQAFKYGCLLTLASVVWIFFVFGVAFMLEWISTHWSLAASLTIAVVAWTIVVTLITWLLFRGTKRK